MAYCERCGMEIQPGMSFCDHCGAPAPAAAPVQGTYQPQGAYVDPNNAQGTYGGAPQGGYGSPAPAKKSSGAGIVIAIVAVLLVCLIGGGAFAAYKLGLFDKLKGGGDITGKYVPTSVELIGEEYSWDEYSEGTWDTTWYGYLHVTNANGDYSDMADETYDCYIDIYVNADDTGELYMYVGGDTEDDIVVWADFTADDSMLSVTEGEFWDMALDTVDWTFYSDGTSITINSDYVDPERTEDDNFTYKVYVKPYGFMWDDDPILPPGYEDYKAELE